MRGGKGRRRCFPRFIDQPAPTRSPTGTRLQAAVAVRIDGYGQRIRRRIDRVQSTGAARGARDERRRAVVAGDVDGDGAVLDALGVRLALGADLAMDDGGGGRVSFKRRSTPPPPLSSLSRTGSRRL